jgi:SAM-dependent methyltransferase
VNEFEAVFSNATLHWITDPEAVAVSISRALRRGGRFVAEFGGRGNIAGLISAFSRAWENLRLPDPASNPWYYPGIPEYSQLLERHHLEVTYAALFDRPTPLEDGQRGLRNWLAMFAGPMLSNVSDDLREKLISEIESEARYDLFRVDHWIMDYRRLRIVAQRL